MIRPTVLPLNTYQIRDYVQIAITNSELMMINYNVFKIHVQLLKSLLLMENAKAVKQTKGQMRLRLNVLMMKPNAPRHST